MAFGDTLGLLMQRLLLHVTQFEQDNGLPQGFIRLHSSSPIDDFDTMVHIGYSFLSGQQRIGGKLEINRWQLMEMDAWAVENLTQRFMASIARAVDL